MYEHTTKSIFATKMDERPPKQMKSKQNDEYQPKVNKPSTKLGIAIVKMMNVGANEVTGTAKW